jgi:hypothetical protein
MFQITPESQEHHYVLREVAKEAATFLSPACRHPHVVQLLGAVVDHRQRPIKLLFERAELGDLEGFVLRLVTSFFLAPDLSKLDVCQCFNSACTLCLVAGT